MTSAVNPYAPVVSHRDRVVIWILFARYCTVLDSTSAALLLWPPGSWLSLQQFGAVLETHSGRGILLYFSAGKGLFLKGRFRSRLLIDSRQKCTEDFGLRSALYILGV